ncbi:galactosylgalactosylxylosylprotein 3-beta-glucuronosyltransferase 3 isoform X2 [Nematostella vectensis]|uniref:galactosylgalactosylxylosylprotein 3-beta-glucuronosyltransferase 3 isoform X2 n=1 Tax=Nematostella vectensis TaxID=45351 RepID=UPI0020775010|nr:galactosylgalactosylxylosylprotein 3-beta-glucuronosyltransferase 3 isoform X2 [Nematostella vectensis]
MFLGLDPSKEFSSQVHNVNLQSLRKRELHLNVWEKEIKSKMKLLGISSMTLLSRQMPLIYVVTPTHSALTQKADLTRLSQTLLHIPQMHWIVVEDSEIKTPLVTNFLHQCGNKYTHLNIRTRNESIRKGREPRWLKNRGVDQRNLALSWMREHHNPKHGKAVVYFADDDNTYDIRIFEMMRYTKGVSVWPVGIVGGLIWEGPMCKDGQVIKFHTDWLPERPLPLDMAGFAINVQLLLDNPSVNMDPFAKRGYVESSIVGQLVTREDLEPLADDCTKVLVWHTQTATPKIKNEERLQRLGKGSPTMEV